MSANPPPASSVVNGYTGYNQDGSYANNAYNNSSYVGIAWNFNNYPGYYATTCVVNGVSAPSASTNTSTSGAFSVNVANGTQVYCTVTDNQNNSYSLYVTAGTTPPAPPPPPAAPSAPAAITGLTATPAANSISLTWSGSATGYLITNNRNSNAPSVSALTFTDNSPPAIKPVTYTVAAYNSGAGGTTYAPGVSVTVGVGDSAGILLG